MRILKTTLDKIQDMMVKNITENRITVDSFWEDHTMEGNHYSIQDGDSSIGYFIVHGGDTITSFYLEEEYAHYGQELFEQIKKYEKVTNALVPTGDEFFLAHCVDSFQRMEKQAYFSLYKEEEPSDFIRKDITFERVLSREDISIVKLAGDFFREDEGEWILKNRDYYRVYKVLEYGELVGFGVVETGRVQENIASIGMFVMEEKRQLGYAKNILRQLKELVEKEGYEARSGCWYYNHNSLKSMKSAGAYPKSRLLRFYF
jgi:GNAT superfamily N-acetyltransferase